ncbi:hypothetical protein CDAR_310121 [Caerostris darwini]|uniref:Uncharacterized protein n=1 Tax=Caerostris darwini TaxID=1538125 RepID=A0AAV4WS59_9ARAC|nr:hypothetical protein CDAR_310121 [Caerostris darwini]
MVKKWSKKGGCGFEKNNGTVWRGEGKGTFCTVLYHPGTDSTDGLSHFPGTEFEDILTSGCSRLRFLYRIAYVRHILQLFFQFGTVFNRVWCEIFPKGS